MKVIIGTPSIDGKIDVNYMHSLKDTILEGIIKKIEIIPITVCYDSLLPRARNDLFEMAYSNDIDCLFFIDADMSWSPYDFFKLINSEKHIIGAPVIKKTYKEELYNVKAIKKKNKLILDYTDNLMEVEGIGTGFLKIDKYAIKKIWKNSKKYVECGKEKRNVFFISINDNEIVGEDINFCNQWRTLKEKLYIDISINPIHIGQNVYQGNFKNFINKLNTNGENNGRG